MPQRQRGQTRGSAVVRTSPDGIEPLQPQREHENQQRTEHKRRQANARHRQRHRDVIRRRVRPQRRDDPRRHADEHGDDHPVQPSSIETGSDSPMSSLTVRFAYLKDGPRSPRNTMSRSVLEVLLPERFIEP